MSTFGQMEAEWRDQQSGARDQHYDEEQVDEGDGGSVEIEGATIAHDGNPFLPKPQKARKSVVRDQSASGKGARKKDAA